MYELRFALGVKVELCLRSDLPQSVVGPEKEASLGKKRAVCVRLERETAEFIGNEAEARLGFALANVEKKQLLEIGGREFTSRRVDEFEKELLALVEHHTMSVLMSSI